MRYGPQTPQFAVDRSELARLCDAGTIPEGVYTGCPVGVDLDLVRKHEATMQRFYGIGVDERNRVGGMLPDQLVSVLLDRRWRPLSAAAAVDELVRVMRFA